MAFQPINFANIAPIGLPGIASAPEQFAKGFNVSQLPKEAEAKRLANALNTLKLEQEPGRFKSEQALRAAQTGSAQSKALEAQFKQNLLRSILGGEPMAPSSSQSAPGMRILSGLQSPQQDATGSNESMGAMQKEPQQPAGYEPPSPAVPSEQRAANLKGMSYPQAAVAMQIMGMGQPRLIDIDGKQMAVTPWGNIKVAEGMTPLQKALTGSDAKQIASMEEAVANSYQQKDTTDELASIMSSPTFESMRQFDWTPGYELGYYKRAGTPEQQDMAGQFMALSGNLVKASARDFAGQFRTGEQALLMDMKPNASDSLGVARGKLQSLMLMREMMSKRSALASKLARSGKYTPNEALKKADEFIDAKAIRERIKQQVTGGGAPVPMVTPDGRRVMVPPKKVNEFLSKGGRRG